MSDREQIFDLIRKANEPLPERTAYPQWEDILCLSAAAAENADTLALFRAEFTAVGGVCLDGYGALRAWLEEQQVTAGYVDSALQEAASECLAGLDCHSRIQRDRIDSYQFGITPASGAIAETGTLVLRDADTPYRLAALAPWIHVAVVRQQDIVHSLTEAVHQLGSDPSIVYVTGPSKTADIEGILIQGVHGPGIQACCIV
jgi:L-lactate dehydrogenase complex protein LldG